MDLVLRALAVYVIMMLIFRISGKRTLSQLSVFDLVLVVIVAEATESALVGDEASITTTAIVVLTLVSVDRVADFLSWRLPRVDRVLNGSPLILIRDGEALDDRMEMSRITRDEIMEKARASQGLERLDQIKYAVLERDGSISIIPSEG